MRTKQVGMFPSELVESGIRRGTVYFKKQKKIQLYVSLLQCIQ